MSTTTCFERPPLSSTRCVPKALPSDNRADLARVSTPSLVVQCREDAIAPPEVGAYVAAHLEGSELVTLDATGHCPNLSAPEVLVAAMREHLPAT